MPSFGIRMIDIFHVIMTTIEISTEKIESVENQ